MKIKAVAKEMKEADVRFISLVARGANRIPFRIVKSEKESEMIDLSKPLRILKGDKATKEAVPEVVGVVVFDQGDEAVMAGVRKSLTDHGFAVDNATKNEDGTVLFSAGDLDASDATIVRLSEDMAVVVKGFSSYNQTLSESTNFSEVMAAQGYYQGVRTACDALVYTMQNVLQKAESSQDAATKVGSILSSFGTYVGAMTKGLPVAAFKADMSVSEVVKSAKAKPTDDKAPEGADEKEWAQMSPEQKEEWKAKAKAKKDEADAAAVAAAAKTEGEQGKTGDKPAGEGEQAPAAAAAAPAEKSEQSDAGGIKEVLAQLADLSDALKGVVGEVAGVAKAQKNLEGQVEEIARKADNATKAVKTTVVAGAGAGDEPAKGTPVVKKSEDPRSGCFDTAFLPKRR